MFKFDTGSGLEHLNDIPSWDEYFLSFYKNVRTRSKDKHTKVGCVVVNQSNNIIMTGYNSLPAGANDFLPDRYERPEKYFWMAHSEENAICACAKAGISTKGARIYLGGIPCMNCARLIVGAGVAEVVYDATEHLKWNSPTYDAANLNRSETLFKECGVTLRGVTI